MALPSARRMEKPNPTMENPQTMMAIMTARPGRLKSMIDVDLEHPRDVTSAAFGQLMKPVYAALKEEVLKAAEAAKAASAKSFAD